MAFTMSMRAIPTRRPHRQRIGPPHSAGAIRTGAQQQSALTQMFASNAGVAAERAGGPWVRMPTTVQKTKLDLTQAFLAESRGVRDLDLQGATLVINARNMGDAHAQCATYAQIASAAGPRVTSIAMSDLDADNGLVTFCKVADNASGVTGGAPVVAASDTPTGQYAIESKLRADMTGQSISLYALSLGKSELWLYYENNRYRKEAEAVGRLVRVLMADAPPSIEIFHLIPTIDGVPMQEITVARSSMERAIDAHGTAPELGQAISFSAPPLDNPALDPGGIADLSAFLLVARSQACRAPLRPRLRLCSSKSTPTARPALELAPGLAVGTELTANIWNNYTFTRPAGSLLPHVRTDLLEYLKKGANGISALGTVYQARLARDVFVQVKAGYLEDMYMGAGGQVLWRPEDSRIAIGFDLYQVWKRDFDRMFGIQSYNILTGHASLYYRSPWYGLNFNIHAGRYLAGDYGATFEVTRRFSTGIEIGAFATFTECAVQQIRRRQLRQGHHHPYPVRMGIAHLQPVFLRSSPERAHPRRRAEA